MDLWLYLAVQGASTWALGLALGWLVWGPWGLVWPVGALPYRGGPR